MTQIINKQQQQRQQQQQLCVYIVVLVTCALVPVFLCLPEILLSVYLFCVFLFVFAHELFAAVFVYGRAHCISRTCSIHYILATSTRLAQ